MVIAGTRITKNQAINKLAMQYLYNTCMVQTGEYLQAESYGNNSYNQVIGDLRIPSRIQKISYELITHGYVHWYSGFDPYDSTAAGCSYWAQIHHNGVYKGYINDNNT